MNNLMENDGNQTIGNEKYICNRYGKQGSFTNNGMTFDYAR